MSTASSLPPVPAIARPQARRWEIDALRGLMLLLMTVTHIPTRFSDPLGQPFGFVSAAEGFVLLSAYVAGMVYTQRQLRDGASAMREAFWRRTLKIYWCQAGLLAFLLGVVAVIGVATSQPAITNLVSYFLAHPAAAFFSGLLLVYNPPLLDILPMYILFMLASPLVLLFATRRGWGIVLAVSGAVWLAAQFGLSQLAYDELVRLTGIPVPYRETGSFEILAWQFLWFIGLWMGASEASGRPVQPTPFPAWAVRAAVLVVALHFVWRHLAGQVPFPGHDHLNLGYDKWQLGPMRLINFLALVMLAMHWAPTLVRRVPRWSVLELLGRQSLPVFCAHLVVAMTVLASVGAVDPTRPWAVDAVILGLCFAVLYAVAVASERIDRKATEVKRRFREQRARRPRSTSSGWRRLQQFQRRLSDPGAPKSRFARLRNRQG